MATVSAWPDMSDGAGVSCRGGRVLLQCATLFPGAFSNLPSTPPWRVSSLRAAQEQGASGLAAVAQPAPPPASAGTRCCNLASTQYSAAATPKPQAAFDRLCGIT